MKRAWRIAVVVAIVVTVAVIFSAKLRRSEPEFEGKPLSEWTIQLFNKYPRSDAEAVHALRMMGEPAVQQLSVLLEREDSPLTKELLEQSRRYPALREVVSSSFWYRYCAARALGEIGTNATSAIPALTRTSQSTNSMLAVAAKAALIRVQNEPIDKYLSAFFDGTNKISPSPYGVLVALGPYAEAAIPRLLSDLASPEKRYVVRATQMLGHIGINSPECFVALTNLLSHSESMVRWTAVNALANYGDVAKPATPLVAKLIEDQDSYCQNSALLFLHRVLTTQEFVPYRARVEQMTNATPQITADLAKMVLREKVLEPKAD